MPTRPIPRWSTVGCRFGTQENHPDGVLTDTWMVQLDRLVQYIAREYGDELARDGIDTIKRDIEGALLADSAWPVDFGRPDLPARYVRFKDEPSQ